MHEVEFSLIVSTIRSYPIYLCIPTEQNTGLTVTKPRQLPIMQLLDEITLSLEILLLT